ncbi:MAG TPA: FimV/HubP family polar landmark protein [Xanthomonadaceae bacterium]|nr:FimV/HubP family polar landmark protein [Xanthomonadaceae bacterium]
MSHRLRTALAVALAAALAIVAGPAAALGLGQIHVKSRPGQPLLAEIPIVTSDPAELQGLQVRLASPETFRRIGLEPPQGDVSALHFEPALDDQGRPVIRITSPAPVQQPLLTFLVEVDWSGGRLVREYSALVETPRTVAAPAQPPIEAPVVAPPNTIQAPAVASEPLPPPVAVTTAESPPAAPAATASPTPVATAVPSAQASASTAAPAPAAPVAATPAPPSARSAPAAAKDRYEVRQGDTLYRIAAGLRAERGDGLDQAMIALLRANPRAFIGGNINRLKAGAVLRMPSAEQVASLDAAQAAAIVHEQIAGWRAERRALQQPVAATTGKQAKADRGTRTASADARLEIVPPSGEGARQAGSRSGVDAGGEGEMLRQQLQETRETLAARDAEVSELKARVAELEKIRHDQQQLIEMKDSALAAAQQNLHKANATATQPAPSQQAQPQSGQTGGLLLWGGAVLVIAAFVGWLLARRRRPAAGTTAARRFDTAALAASIPTSAPQPAANGPESESEPEPGPIAPEAAPLAAARAAQAAATPSWHAGQAADAPAPAAAAESPAPGAPKRPPEEQLDLAQAYLDVGDEEAARTLLREVLDGRDPAARATAARMLRDL